MINVLRHLQYQQSQFPKDQNKNQSWASNEGQVSTTVMITASKDSFIKLKLVINCSMQELDKKVHCTADEQEKYNPLCNKKLKIWIKGKIF